MTDAAGRFAAPGVPPVPLQIEVRPRGSLAPTYARWDPPGLDAESTTPEYLVRVELPAPGLVRGRVLAPPGASMQGIELMIAPADQAERGGAMPWTPVFPAPVRAALDPAGEFGSLELQPGRYRAALVAPLSPTEARPVNAWIRAPWLEGVELNVESGAEHLFEIDARTSFPAMASLGVSLDGAPAAGGQVSWSPWTQGAPSTKTELDGLGRTEAQPVPPGTYTLDLGMFGSSRGPALQARLAREVVVRPGERLELDYAVESFEGRVELTFAEGTSESFGCTLRQRTEAGWITLDFPPVDSSNALELWLVAGDYRLDFDEAGSAEFRWPASSNPLRLAVEPGEE